MTMNVKGLKDAPLEIILDEGVYDVEITKAVFEPSKQKGTPGFNVNFKVKDGPVQKNGDTPNGKVIFYSIWFSEKTTEKALSDLKKLFIACELEIPEDDEVDPAVFLGRQCRVTVRHKTDDYGTRPEVKKIEKIA